ncbi:MAG: hypothetical protein CL814_14525 [Confluentimicrobium sp.]|jgi:hypothetical protein|uniref:DUF4174 domain-containing protein n=1 Tax=Actibacterium sp. TaxID=1872125 RepID=UPI000C433786|nr:DUF4174 domain-containing protein [Actibacterium sp.]MBC58129.1 hypothetical protein [Actibacterium sp.]
MKILLLCAFAGLMPLAVTATEAPTLSPLARWQANAAVVLDAREVDLADFQWLARAVIVFADTSADPRFQQQMALLAELPGELAQRDVVVIVDTDPAARSQPRQKLRPRGFMLALVAKDGTVSLRKPFPWDVRELSRAIDKMPLRQQEIRDRREQQ